MQALVNKSRKPEFELSFTIHDLNNVPLVSGTSFVKWHISSSAAAEHRGRTPKSAIKEHKVVYDFSKTVTVRLTVGKDQVLQESTIRFEILQEYSSDGKGERITLGVLSLNLSEYVGDEQDTPIAEGQRSVTRRYLMQESKINSTLKIEIEMKHVKGDKNYTVPPLKTAPVFGGIAGTMTYEADVTDEPGNLPSLYGKNKENAEAQDMYRRKLAATWAAAPGQLSADECIEDIFAGGDGWGAATRKARAEAKSRAAKEARGYGHGEGGSFRSPSNSNLAYLFSRSQDRVVSPNGPVRDTSATDKDTESERPEWWKTKLSTVPGRASLEHQTQRLSSAPKADRRANPNEIDELNNDIQNSLRCWQIRTPVDN